MPSTKVGGKPYRHNPKPFQEHDSNTICDVTGFRVKMSDVSRRWEGFYVIAEAWHPRQPQDFPVTPVKQQVYKDARKSDADIDIPITTIDPGDFV